MKQTKKQLFFEIVRFLLVGGLATLADYLLFWILDAWLFPLVMPVEKPVWATVSLVLATGAGFCAGLLVNWVLSVRFVFRAVKDEKEARSKKSFAVFTVIGVIGLILTEVGVLALVAVFPPIAIFGKTALFGTETEKWIAKGIMTCLVLIWNYIGRKLFVFKSK
ncbi:MAG: GtrA family protein [Clostridia bacterium]|nr:GtrA family protein [Clostridia bacterium]